ncbi:MAG: CinA family protein [Zetaproteobacteria bacterium]|nr:MAG: CinA family protein [Zetaproteobacteria bacterium]
MLVIAEDAELAEFSRRHARALGDLIHSKDGAACYRNAATERLSLLLAPGHLVHLRHDWLSWLADGAPLKPLAVCLGDAGRPLEPGLSVARGTCLNRAGLLPEEQLLHALRAQGLSLLTAESCTAGGIAARMARVPGASRVLAGGLVTYSNAMKQTLLGVSPHLLAEHGAVSRPVVEAMAVGGCRHADLCIAVSGIAGPGGGSLRKPVGTVWMAVAMAGAGVRSRRCWFPGARAEVQARTVVHALAMALRWLEHCEH